MHLHWNGVDIWSIDLTERGLFNSKDLSADEVYRASLFASDKLARRFVASHVGLRRLLASRLGLQPRDVVLEVNGHGKLRLGCGSTPHERVRFSLAHSQDVALVAMAPDIEVGIDVEHLVGFVNANTLAADILTTGERAAFRDCPPTERPIVLARHWVRKEAVLKAVGIGLQVSLSTIETGPTGAAEGVTQLPFATGAGPLAHWKDIHLPGVAAFAAVALHPS